MKTTTGAAELPRGDFHLDQQMRQLREDNLVVSAVAKVWDQPPTFDLGHGVSLRAMHLHVTGVDVRDDVRGGPGLVLRAVVGERDTGMPISLAFHIGVDGIDRMPDDPLERREVIKNALMQMLEHELDELLLVDGERVADPHRIASMEMTAGMRP